MLNGFSIEFLSFGTFEETGGLGIAYKVKIMVQDKQATLFFTELSTSPGDPGKQTVITLTLSQLFQVLIALQKIAF